MKSCCAAHKNCQSCGMPLKRDEAGGGSNADGSKSEKYCSHCFLNGKFTWPDASFDEMKAKVKDKLKEFGVPGFLTGFFTCGMRRLERWKK